MAHPLSSCSPTDSPRPRGRVARSRRSGAAACTVAWCLASPAWAGDPIVVVGGPPVVADGQTTAVVQFWSPAIGPEAKISVKGAPLVGEPRLDGGDFASIEIAPAAVSAAGELQLKVKVASADGKGAGVLRVPVVPADRGDIGLTFDPPLFRHGVDNAVSIRITPPAGPREAGSQTLEVHSNVGIIDTVTAEDGGRTFVARWRPPKDLPGSQMALFAVVDTAAPDRVLGTAAYPVVVKKALELPAPAGTTAVLTVGERQFGPLPAGPGGKVRFEVERDPRVTVGRLRIVAADGGVTESDVELAFGEGPRFTFVPPPAGAQADPARTVQVSVVAVNPDGSPWTKKAPDVKVDRGTVSGVVATEPGRFVVTYTPDASPGTVTFTATLDGQSASRSMQLVAPADRAARTGSFEPSLLEGTARDAVFSVEGAAPGAVLVSGGTVRGRLSGSGPYTQDVRLDGSSAQMVARAASAVQPSGRPVTRLFIWTQDQTVQADAATQTPVLVVAVDDQGQPVPRVPLTLTVAAGVGTVTEALETGADGLAAGLYTAGNQVGPVTLEVRGAGVHAAAPLFLEGAGYTGAELSTSGDAATLADRQAWIDAVAVARAGRPFPAAQPAVAPMTGADIARLEAEKKAREKAEKKAARAPTGGATASAGGAGGASAPAAGGPDPLSGLGPAPADGLGRSELRVGLHVGASPRNYAAEGEGVGSVPGGEATFTTPGFNAPAFDARGVKWFDTVGAEGRIRYVHQAVAVPGSDDPIQLGGLELLLGARLRGAILPGLSWQLGGGFHAQSISAFTLSEDGIEEAAENLNGVRLAGGATLDRGAMYVATEVAGTFTLAPSAFQFDTVLGYEVTENIAAQLVYTFTKRGATVSDGDATIDVSEGLNGIFVGAAFALP